MKKLLFLFGISCLPLFLTLTINADEPVKWIEYCRCHNDGSCRLGSPISFRPACAAVYVPTPDYVADCSGADINCQADDKIKEEEIN